MTSPRPTLLCSDAAWCWFSDPRAIIYGDWIVAGGVSSQGDVVASLLHRESVSAQTVVLAPGFEQDDHDNPAFFVRQDGRLTALYTKHMADEIVVQTTRRPFDPTEWDAPRTVRPNDPTFQGPPDSRDNYTYPNPQRLADGRLVMLYRGMNWKPTATISADDGETWSTGALVIPGKEGDRDNRPYVKVAGDGRQIFVGYTDGHPREEATNSIYLAAFDGEQFAPFVSPVVYDGAAQGVRAWIWDLAIDGNGHPVVAYVRLPDDGEYSYWTARWNGSAWVHSSVSEAGRWFPRTSEGEREREPHYAGGIAIDPNDVTRLAVSRPVDGLFTIFLFENEVFVRVSEPTGGDHVRPFFLADGRLTWMEAVDYRHYTRYTARLWLLLCT